MKLNILNKYTEHKEKLYYESFKIASSLIRIDKSILWKNQTELNRILKSLSEIYVKNYYFLNNENIDLSEYFSFYDSIDTEYKDFLCSILRLYRSMKIDFISNYNKESNYLVVLFSVVSFMDKYSNPLSKNKLKIKSTLRVLLNKIKESNDYKVFDKNKIYIKDYYELLSNNIVKEGKFLNKINDNDSYNTFSLLNDNVFLVNYIYNISSQEAYDKSDVDRVYIKNYIFSDHLFISYNLGIMTLLKDYLINGENNKYVFPVSENILTTKTKLNSLIELFNNEFVKKNIYIIINYSDYNKYTSSINLLHKNGFKLMIYPKKGDSISNKVINSKNDIILIDNSLYEENKGIVEFLDKIKINYIIKGIDKVYNEEDVINNY